MAFERFIAFRYLITKQRFGFMTVISWISIIGVTIGVAALVVILSVFNGFSGLVTTILVNFDPHIRIERIQPASYEEFSNAEEYVKNQKDVISVGPFVQGKAMIIHRSAVRVINVRGIETKSAKPFAGISKNIVLGEFDFEGSNTKGIVLGFTLADRLGAVIGDTLSIVSPAGFEFAFLQLGQPIIRRFKVIGIYESNNKDYDLFYSYVNLSMAQELFHMNKMISGLEVRLSNFEFAPMYKNKIQAQLGNGFRIFSWYDLHRDLYTVMKIEHWLAYIILGLIIGVASFNLLGLLTMSVIEKTRDIGILKSIGATGKSIVKIHMAQGILVGVSGTVFGIGLGLLLVYMQQQYHLFPLDPTVYIIPAIPVEVKISDLIAIAVMSIGFCSIAAIYPAKRASRLIPAEAIRWE